MIVKQKFNLIFLMFHHSTDKFSRNPFSSSSNDPFRGQTIKTKPFLVIDANRTV